MSKLVWDQMDQRVFETGVDHGVLYLADNSGDYVEGHSWNGLTAVTESPSGAEPNPQYADNIKYLNLTSAEDFGATIEAFTYPDEFGQCDGTATPTPGVSVGQQGRRSFGLSYRTKVGNALNSDLGYKIHLIYGAMAAPSEKAYNTINDSPEAVTFSWELSTTPSEVGEVEGIEYKPTASIVVDSTKVDATALAALEDMLYGTVGTDPFLPSPAEVIAMFAGTLTSVTPTVPTYNSTTDLITIPSVTGVQYKIDGEVVAAGTFGPITANTVVVAEPLAGYYFPEGVDNDWLITFA